MLIHTRRVCESLVALEEWRALSSTARSLVFAATLFHDIGKAWCTRVDDDGTITSRGHANRSVTLARQLMYCSYAVPLPCRETICALIRHHGLPLSFMEKARPERAVAVTSLRTRCDWLALVAQADVLGRECADKAELLARVALFKELCAELRCSDQPRAFASEHARFAMCNDEDAELGYEPYDTSRFEVIVMSGLPGAGKDHWIAQNASHLPVISLDSIRAEMGVSPEDEQGQVVAVVKEQARAYARKQQPFVWNATNVSRELRRGVIGLLASYKARIRLIYVEAPYGEIVARNRRRSRPVPLDVIERLVEKLDVPDLTEAHFVEWVSNG